MNWLSLISAVAFGACSLGSFVAGNDLLGHVCGIICAGVVFLMFESRE